MKLRKLGNSGLMVSDLCLGTMNFGMAEWGVDEPTSLAVINAYVDACGPSTPASPGNLCSTSAASPLFARQGARR